MTNGTQPEDEYIDANAAAELLGVSPRQALRYAADGIIQSRHVGRRVFLHRGDVQDLAEQRAVPNVEQAAGRLVQTSALSVRVEEQQRELVQAAHTIGVLEERVRQLEAQLSQRPLLEDHSRLQAEREAALRHAE